MEKDDFRIGKPVFQVLLEWFENIAVGVFLIWYYIFAGRTYQKVVEFFSGWIDLIKEGKHFVG